MGSDETNHICSSCRGVKKRDMVVYVIDLFAIIHLKFNVVCSLLISLFNYCTSSSMGNISTNIWALLASVGLLVSDFLLNDLEDEDINLGDHTKFYFGDSLTLMKGSLVGVHLVVLYCNLGDWLLLSLLFIAAATFICKNYFKKKKEKKKTRQEYFMDECLMEVIRLVGGVEDDMQELKEEVEQLIKEQKVLQKEQRKPLAEINSSVAVTKLKIQDLSVEAQNTRIEVRHVKSEIQIVKAMISEIQKTLNQPSMNRISRKLEGCSRLECCHCSLLPPSFVFQCNIGHLLCQPCLPLLSGAYLFFFSFFATGIYLKVPAPCASPPCLTHPVGISLLKRASRRWMRLIDWS